MTRGHWTTVQMVVHANRFKKFQDFLKSLDGEIIPDKTSNRGSFVLCRTKIPAENKEILLDSQVRFL